MKLQLFKKKDSLHFRPFFGWGEVNSCFRNSITWTWDWRQIQFGSNWYWERPFNIKQPNFTIEGQFWGFRIWYTRQTWEPIKLPKAQSVRVFLLLFILSLAFACMITGLINAIVHHK